MNIHEIKEEFPAPRCVVARGKGDPPEWERQGAYENRSARQMTSSKPQFMRAVVASRFPPRTTDPKGASANPADEQGRNRITRELTCTIKRHRSNVGRCVVRAVCGLRPPRLYLGSSSMCYLQPLLHGQHEGPPV